MDIARIISTNMTSAGSRAPESDAPVYRWADFPAPEGGGEPKVEVTVFHALWCGACKRFMPGFEAAREHLAGQDFPHKAAFSLVDHESKEIQANPEMAATIRAYPTLRLVVNGNTMATLSTADRTPASFFAFLQRTFPDIVGGVAPKPEWSEAAADSLAGGATDEEVSFSLINGGEVTVRVTGGASVPQFTTTVVTGGESKSEDPDLHPVGVPIKEDPKDGHSNATVCVIRALKASNADLDMKTLEMVHSRVVGPEVSIGFAVKDGDSTKHILVEGIVTDPDCKLGTTTFECAADLNEKLRHFGHMTMDDADIAKTHRVISDMEKLGMPIGEIPKDARKPKVEFSE